MEDRVTLSVRQEARKRLDDWWGNATNHAYLFALAVPIFESRYGRSLRYFTKREYVWVQDTSLGGNEHKAWREWQEMHATDRKIIERIIDELGSTTHNS